MSTVPRRALPALLVLVLLIPAASPADARSLDDALDLVELPEAADLPAVPLLDDAPARRAPADWTVPGRVVVGFDRDATLLTPALAALASDLGGRVLRVDATLDFAVVTLPAGAEDRLVKLALGLDGVRYARQDARAEAFFTPDDPFYGGQWGPAAINMPSAWNVTRGTHNVTVAVLDTGVNASHPDLAPNACVAGPDYPNGDANPADDQGHGTHVAGTVAAAIDNGLGVAGMADACIMAVKVLDGGGSGTFSDVASGIAWAADNGAHVISMSLGGCPGCDPGAPLSDAVVYAEAAGALVVAAAGNAGCAPVSYPAGYPSVVAVAALAPPGNVTASFSSCGDKVELSAPGQEVLSTALTSGPLSHPSGYMNLSGTSMATPHVAGVAALLWGAHPTLTNHQVRCILAQTADDVMAPGRDANSGYGRVDAAAALASPACVPLPPGVPALRVRQGFHEAGPSAILSWTQPASFGSNISSYEVYRSAGGAPFEHVASTPSRSITLGPLEWNVTYAFEVAAVNAEGEGTRSAPATLTPLPPFAIPYEDGFEGGAPGWTATGQWHLTTDRNSSPTHAWYYGMENGPGLDDNTYDDGQTNAGELLSPALALPADGPLVLSLWHRWEGEGSPYEHPIVQVSTAGGEGPWTTVAEHPAASGEGALAADLTAFAGQVVHVRFLWDTRDPIFNHYEGWYVDDVRVAEGTVPPPTCDGVVDAFGNRCESIPYAFEDLGALGTALPLGDDLMSAPLSLPFPVSFYGRTHGSVRVSSNGFLAFGDDGDAGCCAGDPIPSTLEPDDLVAGFWTDLYPGDAGVTYGVLGSPGARTFVVQFTDVPFCCNGTGATTFQFKLVEATGAIEVHYANASALGNGYLVSAGIEDCAGTDGIQMGHGALDLRTVAVRYVPGAGAPPSCDANQPPVAAITVPSAGATLSGQVWVLGNASDPDGDAMTVFLAVDGATYATANTTGGWGILLDTTLFVDGNHTLGALAWDGETWGPAHNVTVRFENGASNAPPTAGITSPAHGATVQDVVLVTGWASDPDAGDAVEGVSLRVDNVTYSANGTSNWSFWLDTRLLANGWHVLAASAHDGEAYGPESGILVHVDNPPPYQPPFVVITTPSGNDTVSGNVRIEGYAWSSSAEIVLVQVRVDGGEWMDAAGTWSWAAYWQTRAVANGWHLVEARSFDGIAFSPTDAVSVLVENDDRPAVHVLSPRNGDTVAGIVLVQGDADDDVGVVSVELRVDGGEWRPATGTTAWSRYVDTRVLPDGVHDIEARAYDGEAYSRVALVQVLVLNHQGPRVDIETPASGDAVGGLVQVAGRAAALEGAIQHVEVSVGWGAWRLAEGTSSWTAQVDLSGYADGDWVALHARAWDGVAYGYAEPVYVAVRNLADVAIAPGDIVVERSPLRTGLGDAPNLVGETRTIRVTVRNLGAVASDGGLLNVAVESLGVKGTGLLARVKLLESVWIGPIPAGGSETVELRWDTTDAVGDMRIHALMEPGWGGELRYDNNQAHVEDYVLVGGTGVGA